MSTARRVWVGKAARRIRRRGRRRDIPGALLTMLRHSATALTAPQIGERAGLSVEMVRRYLGELEAAGPGRQDRREAPALALTGRRRCGGALAASVAERAEVAAALSRPR